MALPTTMFKVGIGGNYYVYSPRKSDVVNICEVIGKATGSVYYNEKFDVWAIKVKDKVFKYRLKEHFK